MKQFPETVYVVDGLAGVEGCMSMSMRASPDLPDAEDGTPVATYKLVAVNKLGVKRVLLAVEGTTK